MFYSLTALDKMKFCTRIFQVFFLLRQIGLNFKFYLKILALTQGDSSFGTGKGLQ